MPTALGLKMIELLPAHAVAVWHACNLAPQDPDEDAVQCWERRTWEPIRELAEKATNIVDIAIAQRIWHGDGGDIDEELTDRLVDTLLKAAHVKAASCSQEAMWKKNGWHRRTPSLEERRAALAQIPAAEIEEFRRERAEALRSVIRD
jgi:hypothetical protein